MGNEEKGGALRGRKTNALRFGGRSIKMLKKSSRSGRIGWGRRSSESILVLELLKFFVFYLHFYFARLSPQHSLYLSVNLWLKWFHSSPALRVLLGCRIYQSFHTPKEMLELNCRKWKKKRFLKRKEIENGDFEGDFSDLSYVDYVLWRLWMRGRS